MRQTKDVPDLVNSDILDTSAVKDAELAIGVDTETASSAPPAFYQINLHHGRRRRPTQSPKNAKTNPLGMPQASVRAV